MVLKSFEHWDRLLFRDYLRDHPEVATEYGTLKRQLSAAHPRDRVAYTQGKSAFICTVTKQAKTFYGETVNVSGLTMRTRPETAG